MRKGDRRAAEKDVLPLCDACIEEMRALALLARAVDEQPAPVRV